MHLVGFGEVLPRFDNFLAIDPKVVDKFGNPMLKITMSWGESDKARIQDMAVAHPVGRFVAGCQVRPRGDPCRG